MSEKRYPEVDATSKEMTRRKLMLGYGLGAIAVGSLASQKAEALGPTYGDMKTYFTIKEMIDDTNNIAVDDVVVASSWFGYNNIYASFASPLGMFYKMAGSTLSGLTSDTIDWINAGNGIVIPDGMGNYFLRILDSHPSLTMWQPDSNGYWDDAFKSAIYYIQIAQFELESIINQYDPLIKMVQTLEIPPGKYYFYDKLTIEMGDYKNDGISIIGSSTQDTILKFDQSGLEIKGWGTNENQAATRFRLENLHFDGQNNTHGDFGLSLDTCYIVKITDCFIRNFHKTGSVHLKLNNCFNFKWDGGSISGSPDPYLATGGDLITISNDGGIPEVNFVNSNIQFFNTLIQRGIGVGVRVGVIGATMDNLRFDNVCFSHNIQGSFLCADTPQNGKISNLTFSNCHFEYKPEHISGSTHVHAKGIMGLNYQDCVSVHAETHVKVEKVRGFSISGSRFLNSGIPAGEVAIDVDEDSYGVIGPNAFNNLARKNVAGSDPAIPGAPARVQDLFSNSTYTYDDTWF